MYAAPLRKGPVYVHLDDTRLHQLSVGKDESLTHLVIDVTKNTYSLEGNGEPRVYDLPSKFATEVRKLGGSLSSDLAWTLFRRIVLEQEVGAHPVSHLNTDLSKALVRNASSPLSPDHQKALETVLLNRYMLFELLLQTRKLIDHLGDKINLKQAEQIQLEKELDKAHKTIEAQRKFIGTLPANMKREALYELESMQLHADHTKRQVTAVSKTLQRMVAEQAAIAEGGIHQMRQVIDQLDPEVIQLSKQLASQEGAFLNVVEKAIEEATHNALRVMEKGEL